MTKQQLRQAVKKSKSLLTADEKQRSADAVFATVEQMDIFASATNILLYNALPDELPTRRFIDRWAGIKQLYLPRVNGDDLDILPFDLSTLRPGAFNIEEPQGDNVVDPQTIDLIIVPGVVFDRHCNRIGRGRGFYDRLLRRTSAPKIGVCYDCQLVDTLPAEPHDIAMDYVVSPGGITAAD